MRNDSFETVTAALAPLSSSGYSVSTMRQQIGCSLLACLAMFAVVAAFSVSVTLGVGIIIGIPIVLFSALVFFVVRLGTDRGSRNESKQSEYFSTNYNWARGRFRKAVRRCGGKMVPLPLSARGRKGLHLTIDVAWFGAEKPRRVFVHSSGLHGVEGFTGSAIQLQCIREWVKNGKPKLPADAAIVFVHAVNPYGMAWLRRFNENNVDLNRNFRQLGEYTPDPPPYWDTVNAFLNPPTPPSRDWFYLRATRLLLRHGMPAMRQAVAGGQCLNPKGLFFGGTALEEGPGKFQEFMKQRLADAERIVAIDVHTGLGRFGEDRLLVDARIAGTDALQAMKQVFGERVELLNKEGIAYSAKGAQQEMYFRSFPRAKVYFASQEFGTYKPTRVLAALRAENRLHFYGARVSIRNPVKRELAEVFNPKSEKWRQVVLARGGEVIQQAVELAFGEA